MAQSGQGGVPNVAVINHATVDLGAPLDKMVAALQKAYDQFFVPVWGYPLKLTIAQQAKPDDWQIVFLDNADDSGALGYHDLTANGQPISKVFVKDTIKNGDKVSVTVSHELFEMAIDPIANLWADAGNGTDYAYEMSDPVEEDVFLVDGIEISNFVHPSWFEPFRHPVGTRFDHLGKLKAPFTMTKGGYVITRKKGVVKEVFGSVEKARRFELEDRRGHRSEYRKSG
jgi:hypothetical protein